MTRGEKIIKFIETFCVIPEGEHVGKPVVLAEFQIKFIKAVYDNPHTTDTAILSIARKNAKTGTIAFLLLAHIVGPEAKRNARIVSGAMSREQAGEVYNLASKCVQLSPRLSDIIKIVPSFKKLIGLPMGVEYQAISAEGKTAHGKSPILAILDEVGQFVARVYAFEMRGVVDVVTRIYQPMSVENYDSVDTQRSTAARYFFMAINRSLTTALMGAIHFRKIHRWDVSNFCC